MRKACIPLPSQEDLLNLFVYNRETGVVTARISHKGRRKGFVIGTKNTQGYLSCNTFGKKYLLHRLIWMMVYGVVPDQIDHINGVKDDNRLYNIRNTSHIENQKNKHLFKSNKSGVPGVYWCGRAKKWKAQIGVGCKNVYIGGFDDLNRAIGARKCAEMLYDYHDNHGNRIA
jgi:hypothetical protein